MVRARKRFGQHFLEPAWVEKLIQVIAPGKDQAFLEIGPGRGALTKPLAARARHVFAFEIDRDLAAGLRASSLADVTVIEGDFLTVGVDQLRLELSGLDRIQTLRAAGNLPYNVASPILFQLAAFFAAGIPLVDATVMLQREVADRLTAVPGTKDYGVLSVLIGLSADVTPLLVLPPGAFRPVPKVTSAVVRLRFRPPNRAPASPRLFQALVQAVFTRRRKTMSNALKAFSSAGPVFPAMALAEAGLEGQRRPETFTQAELVALSDVYAREAGAAPLAPRGSSVL